MGEKTTEYFEMLGIPFECFEDDNETQEKIEKNRLIYQLIYTLKKKIKINNNKKRCCCLSDFKK